MTLFVLRVERRANIVHVEPFLSRRIRLAACRPVWGEGDRKRLTVAALQAA